MREISTLPPKPRAEGSNPSAPAKIAEQKRCSRRNPRIYGGSQRFRGQKMGFEFRRCRKAGRLRAFLVSEKRRSTVLKLVIISRSIGVNPSFF